MAKKGFYGVAHGRKIGVYTEYADVKVQTEGISSAKQKKFPTQAEAQAFVRLHNPNEYDSDEKVPVFLPDTQEITLDGPLPQNVLVAFCYGSALLNGKPHCRAGYACIFPRDRDLDSVCSISAEEERKSNRVVYLAAREALRKADNQDPLRSQELHIFTNSRNLVMTMTDWVFDWQENGWMNSDRQPVKNQDVIEDLVRLSNGRRVEWNHLRDGELKSDWHSQYVEVAKTAAGRASLFAEVPGANVDVDLARGLTSLRVNGD